MCTTQPQASTSRHVGIYCHSAGPFHKKVMGTTTRNCPVVREGGSCRLCPRKRPPCFIPLFQKLGGRLWTLFSLPCWRTWNLQLNKKSKPFFVSFLLFQEKNN